MYAVCVVRYADAFNRRNEHRRRPIAELIAFTIRRGRFEYKFDREKNAARQMGRAIGTTNKSVPRARYVRFALYNVAYFENSARSRPSVLHVGFARETAPPCIVHTRACINSALLKTRRRSNFTEPNETLQHNTYSKNPPCSILPTK